MSHAQTHGAGTGGIAARRAVVRWAWRLFRREWRQQALVLGLLTIAVAAAIGFSAAVYNTIGVPDNATLGSANHRYEVDELDLGTLRSDLAAAAERFGTIDTIATWFAAIPGSVESIEYRSQDPDGPFSAPMLALGGGRYPDDRHEVALTDGIADQLRLGLNDVLALDGRERTVVGLVENPSDLNAEFALVAPGHDEQAELVAILIGGAGGFDEVRGIREFGAEHLPNADVASRDDTPTIEAAAVVLGVAQIALVLVSLIASAGFVAVAQRRLRQLGMLGALGATEKHLRLVVVANGAVIGVVAAALGAVLGLIAWFAAASAMESAVGFRIDPLNVPWGLVAAAMGLVVATASAAAWWPARAVARVPTTNAMSGRPPALRPAHHSAMLAGALVTAGLVLLGWGDRTSSLRVGTGAVATALGVMLLSPIALRTLATVARPMPVASRLALRDLARYRARSGVALAAVSLSLGIPVAIVVTASAAEADAALGNLAPDQMVIWTRDPSQPAGVSPFFTQDPEDEGFSPYLPDLTAAQLADLGDAVNQLAASFGAELIGLDVALDPDAQDDPNGRLAVTLARPTEIGYLDVALVYLASPELLNPYELDLPMVDPDVDILTTGPPLPPDVVPGGPGGLWLSNTSAPPVKLTAFELIEPSYTSLPATLITPAALSERAWETRRVGWLVESVAPFTSAQIAEARDVAVEAGLLVEPAREQESLVALRWGATAAGMLLALGVLAMTVGLIRAEAARDVRLLTATGATSTIRRTLTGSTAGGLAVLGTFLGTVGAYVAVSAGYLRDLTSLTPVPVLPLVVLGLGVPLIAALAGFVLAGREPTDLARLQIE